MVMSQNSSQIFIIRLVDEFKGRCGPPNWFFIKCVLIRSSLNKLFYVWAPPSKTENRSFFSQLKQMGHYSHQNLWLKSWCWHVWLCLLYLQTYHTRLLQLVTHYSLEGQRSQVVTIIVTGWLSCLDLAIA